jgi:hypothetical protein
VTDDDLRDLLTDAVADVEPAYRLDVIKARTSRPPRRRGWYAAGGAILAAAAVVTAVSVVNDDGRPRREAPASNGEHAVALYFVGDTPAGPRLYREFQRVSGGPLAALEAITVEHGPEDPDYTTLWPADLFTSVAVRDDVIEIGLGEWTGPTYRLAPGVHRALLQQVVYTAQAATGEALPVQFTKDGRPTGDPFRGSGDGVIEREPQNDILALVSISDPAEGTVVRGSFVAQGRANSFEGTVRWQIRTDEGVVKEGFATAAGSIDRLYEWKTRVDVSDLPSGHYTFVARTDDPSGGEGRGPFTDTRTIIVD